MKFKKTLAAISAAAVALSSLALSAFAEPITGELKAEENAYDEVTGYALYLANSGGRLEEPTDEPTEESTEPGDTELPGDTDTPTDDPTSEEPSDEPVAVTNYDLTLSTNVDVIPEGAELILEQKDVDGIALAGVKDAIANAIAKATGKAITEVSFTVNSAVTASLVKDGEEVQPTGDMKIFVEKGTSNIVAYIGEGYVEFFALEDIEEYTYFTTPHLSTFYLLTVDEADVDTLVKAGKIDISETDEPTSSEAPESTDNPGTGAQVAVVPALFAVAGLAAATIVLKKRSK